MLKYLIFNTIISIQIITMSIQTLQAKDIGQTLLDIAVNAFGKGPRMVPLLKINNTVPSCSLIYGATESQLCVSEMILRRLLISDLGMHYSTIYCHYI